MERLRLRGKQIAVNGLSRQCVPETERHGIVGLFDEL